MARLNANAPWVKTLTVLATAYIVAALLETVSLLFYSGHPQGQHLGEYYGYASLFCLAAVLLAGPLGWPPLLAWRRGLGLTAFAFACLHPWLMFYHVFGERLEAVEFLTGSEQVAVWLGGLALGLMVPLALTSANFWVSVLGRRWRTLHRLVIPVGIFSVLHSLWLGTTPWPIKGLVVVLSLAVIWRRYRSKPPVIEESGADA